MKRNTPTTFGELRTGDRFYFPTDKTKKAHQLTKEGHGSYVKPSYNIMQMDGKKAWPFDRQAASERPVVFLRHTVPQPGDECMLYDLQKSDAFFFADNVVSEFLIVATDGLNLKEKYLVDCINCDETKIFWQANVPVVYIGRSTIQFDKKKLANVPFNQ